MMTRDLNNDSEEDVHMADNDSEDQTEQVEDIEVKHTFAESYRLVPANGVDGGLQPQGEMKIDFTYDHTYRTTSERYDPDHGFITGLTMDSHMEREHQIGVTMQPEQAYQAAIWILNRVLGESVTREDLKEAIENTAQNGDDQM